MPKKRYRPEEIIGKLREADVLISQGKKVVDVIKALGITDVTYDRWRQEYGGMSVPQEFCARAVRDWLRRLGAGTLFIEPGSPWENGYVESFIGKLRDELLNREIFYTLKEAAILIEQWRRHYNGVRPHSALGYRPPAPETIAFPGMGLPNPWSSSETSGGFLHEDTGGPIIGGWSVNLSGCIRDTGKKKRGYGFP